MEPWNTIGNMQKNRFIGTWKYLQIPFTIPISLVNIKALEDVEVIDQNVVPKGGGTQRKQ